MRIGKQVAATVLTDIYIDYARGTGHEDLA